MKAVRKKLGSIKKVLLDELPYRKAVARIAGNRERLAEIVPMLHPLRRTASEVIEVHMLCGARDIDMGICSSWSLFRFLGGKGRLYVHSDGTITSEHEEKWRSVIGDVIVVERKDAEHAGAATLGEHAPGVLAWRASNWASSQLVDMHLFGDEASFLIMDSDVLCFASPDDLLGCLLEANRPFAWCRDLRDAYSAPQELLAEITGVELPPRLCAGLLATPRLEAEDFIWLEEQLRVIGSDGRIEINHFWSCQTYYALLAAKHGAWKVLPDAYSNTAGATKSGQVLRHYVGIPRVRFRYFEEGIPRVTGNHAGLAVS